MDSFEINKIVGALLAAMLTAKVIGILGDVFIPEHRHVEGVEPVYTVAGAEPEPTPAGAESAAEKPAGDGIAARLSGADAEAGAGLVKKCAACHSFEKGGANKVGPNLWGIVNRPVAAAEGYAYSDALAGHGGDWTYDSLDAFLAAPKDFAPGTKMSFAGIKDGVDRANLIAWLREQSDSPSPLPEVPAAEEAASAAQPEAPGEPAAAESQPPEPQPTEAQPTEPQPSESQPSEPPPTEVASASAGDAAAGAKAARKCTACHSAEEGAAHKIGPNLWAVVGRDIAGAEGYSYSDALSGLDGAWTDQALDAFLAGPKDYAPGTKMSFPGVKSETDRADLIAWLRSLGGAPAEKAEVEAEPAAPAAMASQPSVEQAESATPVAEEPAAMAAPAAVESAEPAVAAEAVSETEAPAVAGEPAAAEQTGQADQSVEGAEAEAEPEQAAAVDIAAVLANADAEAGRGVAKTCFLCHNIGEGQGPKLAPNLWGVVGRPTASTEFKYSDAMMAVGGEWTFERLYTFLANPKAAVPGTRMAFPGVKDGQDRANLLAWLRLQSSDPVPLPQ